MDLRRMTSPDAADSGRTSDSAPVPEADSCLQCSAKGCRREAVHAIRWNNPKLHSPDRRKVWLACDEHEGTLRDFLGVRGFYRDTVPPSQLSPTDG